MESKHQEKFGNEPEEECVEEDVHEAAQEARKILGLKHDATIKDIKKVYRALALEYHPDKNPGDEIRAAEIFKRLHELYEILCDALQLKQNTEEDELKDEEKERDLDELGDVFLPVFGPEVDPVMRRMINAYQSQLEQQGKEKDTNIDIRA